MVEASAPYLLTCRLVHLVEEEWKRSNLLFVFHWKKGWRSLLGEEIKEERKKERFESTSNLETSLLEPPSDPTKPTYGNLHVEKTGLSLCNNNMEP